MKGDFSRRTFNPDKRFSRVLMQQGRVLLDADWNEQVSILLHTLRTVISDFSGPVAPIRDAFMIEALTDPNGNRIDNDFQIRAGHLYLDGILLENDENTRYKAQPDYPVDADTVIEGAQLVYVDAWERHITHVQDESIREVALGGPDTTTRARIVWQVKIQPVEAGTTCDEVQANWNAIVNDWQPVNRGELAAKTKTPAGFATDDPCITPPDARYRGPANRLYRVEIHRGGTAGSATFKWSRENGSIVFAIRTLTGTLADVETLGEDEPRSVAPGDWVEVIDDNDVLFNMPGVLAQVESIDSVERSLTLAPADDSTNLPDYDENSPGHPLLRRWDHKHGVEDGGATASDGGLIIEEGVYITLEDGIEVLFATARAGEQHRYRTGDYWLIPARTATGDIEWPVESDATPVALQPRGVMHHYAALAVVDESGLADCLADLRDR